jgi:HlyD family secretion protein
MFKKLVIIVVVVGVIATAIYLKAKSSAAAKENGIKMVKVAKGDIVEKALAIGRIEPKKEIAVKSKISGIIKKVYVEVGDYVKVGEPLIEVQPDPTPMEYAEAKRSAQIAEVAASSAQNEYGRMKQLLQQKMISEKEYETADNALKEAELKLSLARDGLALLEKGKFAVADRIIDTIIKSPVEGTILERRVNEGDPVVPLTSYQAGTELLLMADMDSLLFKGTVDEIDVGKLDVGMTADLKIGAIPDEKITGRLSRISPKAKEKDNATLFDVEIEIVSRGDKVIRAGYSANADLVINKVAGTLYVPERLVEFKDNKTFVEVKNAAGAIEKKEVQTGLSDGINIEVKSGLKDGDEIVERPPKEIK